MVQTKIYVFNNRGLLGLVGGYGMVMRNSV